MNNAHYRKELVDAIKAQGVARHVENIIAEVRLQLKWHREDLLKKITENRENGVQAFDSETINRMRTAEVDRARRAYGLPAGIPEKP